jgi:hypothetical protein
MAKLNGTIEFTGGLGNVSAYTLRGSDKIILRTKGGASKEKIKTLDSFAKTREINTEWSGCAKTGKGIYSAISPLKHLADYTIIGSLNGMAKIIQKLDKNNPEGERCIYFSQHRELLEGFNLNTQNVFDSVIRRPVTLAIDRSLATATVTFPSLDPQLHLQNKGQRPYFRFIVSLGIVSDMVYSGDYAIYRPLNPNAHAYSCSAETSWFSALSVFEGAQVKLAIDSGITFGDSESLILGAGIEFGNPISNSLIQAIKYSGSAKIMVTG